uniref:Uncharacterized protein n=1 Tax=Panagrolaimus sp. PS1159 TaxID=55785 RepID=A0AC35EVE5_9BILA
MKKLFMLYGFCLVFVAGFGRRQRHIEASGSVGCCYRFPGQREICSTPTRAKIELYDHYYFWEDHLLAEIELEERTSYDLEWDGLRLFRISPYFKLRLECPHGEILEKRHDIFEENPKKIFQNFNIFVPQKT